VPIDRELVRGRVADIRLALAELRRLSSKSFEELSLDEKYSIRYNLILLVEALTSLCIHILLETRGVAPRTYREAIREAAEILEVKCVRELEGLASLRNLLIHRYWVIDDAEIYRNLKTNFRCVEEFLARLEGGVK